jgi:hypothetical protein
MKIIKLKESDLTEIVKKVLSEQKYIQSPYANLNPKNLKFGDRGDDVKALQQKLIDKGYLTTDSMVPTGYFGKLTDAALKRVLSGMPPLNNLRFKLKPTTGNEQKTNASSNPKFAGLNKSLFPKDNANLHSDYLGKGNQFEKETHGGMTQEQYLKFLTELKKIPPSKKSKVPLHVRALMDYLAGRTEPFTAADLTKEEQQFLKNVAISNAKKGLTYPLWKSIGAGNLPTAMTTTGSEKENENLKTLGQGSLANPGLAGEFMYTLGEVDPPAIKVSPDKKSVTVRDNYDFNSVGLPKEKIMQNFTDALSGYFSGKGTLYSVVRNAVAFKEGDGYPGYPVNITV